ncbi:RluA family pseudouridine synthase [Legionella micdadei]|uniref:Pseudouridine synthase n=1 Tax=Legionella micdadei TaxID=451 RepID=A0A098GK32_LEGMI|nr:RluA family pseudouridine synthase [Legionella micdadei]ARG96752.1 RNA pseudouridine synthase [Legionella micdadei]KTD26420.1 ribosomal large subunit pseudouridine synthase [Legionella micdadei]NSL17987.1 RluA family pseudouridine synthase [Legionella micdadei]CEG61866.1 Ribosomal large subunit pseudouridine synthase C [Legionella micdadei]SCY25893.1 23S rRNA pseudouridine955/2504/2580 synthase [Legionella micdadei]
MSDVRYTEIGVEDEGQRLDNYLMRILKGVPKSHIYRIIRAGEVRINKKRAQASSRLIHGDCVRIPPVRTAQDKEVFVGTKLEQRLRESIIFEDNNLLVINKPAGIAVHGGSGLSLGVIEALRKTRNDLPYLELVHRLDKETSGCLLLAKKRSMLRSIHALLEAREVNKTYWALLYQPWQGKKTVVVDMPLEKNSLKSGERIVTVNKEGRASQTVFKLLENYQQACWVEASPKTGRTHQIRVHSAYLGHAIVGDQKYSKAEPIEGLESKSRLYLHARAIQFNLNGNDYLFEANLDEQFAKTLKRLGLLTSDFAKQKLS